MLLRLLKRADFITTAKGRRVSADGFILQGKKREPETDIPSDRAFRAAWEVDESILTDGVGDVHDMFVTDPQHPDYVETEQ